MKRLVKSFAAVILVGIVLTSTASATITGTFDSSAGYATVGDLQTAYSAFMGTTDDAITFEEFTPGRNTPIGDYYLAGKGVRFSSEGEAAILQANGPAYGSWVQGYVDGKPTGNMVYNKVYNDNPATALIISFADPVKEVGSFIADSLPARNTLTVKLYDSAGNLLATVNPQVNVWTNGDNTEGYWGAKSDTAEIAKVTFVSPSTYYAVTSLDDIAWVVPESAAVPEPATIGLLGLGALSLLRRRK